MTRETVDDKMARCPLKQEVREALWERFVRRLTRGKPLASYLTLYSPPMMDLKHFHHRKLLTFDGERFSGVIAVTYSPDHYGAALRQSSGRPELLLYGDINRLLTHSDNDDAKRLRASFPVQAINLDYCNSLFAEKNTAAISDHLAAINEVVRLQRKHAAQQFVLFITTRAEMGMRGTANQFTRVFLQDLAHRIAENISSNAVFKRSYGRAFGDATSTRLLTDRYECFVPVGLSKLVCQILATHSFEVMEMDAAMLVRDHQPPERWILHLAVRARAALPAQVRSLGTLGRSNTMFEGELSGFVERVGRNQLEWLRESADSLSLGRKHGQHIADLAALSLDLKVPEPEKRDGGQR